MPCICISSRHKSTWNIGHWLRRSIMMMMKMKICWTNKSAWKAHDWLKRSIALKLHRIICTQCIFVLSSLSAHWNSRWALSNSNAANDIIIKWWTIDDIDCDDFDDDAGETIGCVTEFTDWRTGWTDLDRHTWWWGWWWGGGWLGWQTHLMMMRTTENDSDKEK